MTLRHALLLLHRYVGLTLAAFLVMAGLTGSVIAFVDELDALLNPELVRVTVPADGASPLDPITLYERLAGHLGTPQKLTSLVLHVEPRRAVNYWVDGRDLFVNPYTSEIVGSRTFGDLREGKKNLLSFVYVLHSRLALGEVGSVLLGAVALLWTIDCFVGAYLTLPRPGAPTRSSRKAWWRRWAASWLVNTSKAFAAIFTWHRASGLWLWGFLLVFAWSGVALTLHAQVYHPVMSLFFDTQPDPVAALVPLRQPLITPTLSMRDALTVGRRLMAEEGQRVGFEVRAERWLNYDAERGIYSYWVDSTLDVAARLAETHVLIDGSSGELRGFGAPAGLHGGDTVTPWLVALHIRRRFRPPVPDLGERARRAGRAAQPERRVDLVEEARKAPTAVANRPQLNPDTLMPASGRPAS